MQFSAHQQAATVIRTERLCLIPATTASLVAAMDGLPALARALEAHVPDTWPPEFLDEPALEFTRRRLDERPEQAAWWMYFVLLRNDPAPPTLVGSAGFKGPPAADGTVEIGYGIVSDHRRRGYASEATRGLVAHAFAHRDVARVIAETLPDLQGSIGVLTRCGFRECGGASESFVIRFELTRPAR